jgi:hypothetical protein
MTTTVVTATQMMKTKNREQDKTFNIPFRWMVDVKGPDGNLTALCVKATCLQPAV